MGVKKGSLYFRFFFEGCLGYLFSLQKVVERLGCVVDSLLRLWSEV